MRRAVRAIIIRDNNLLVMHRNKFGQEYDTLPGGSVDFGESLEQALYREIAEETGIKCDQERLVFLEHAGLPYGDQYIYLCRYLGGEPNLSTETHEYKINKLGQNLYQPKWLDLKLLPDAPFVSDTLKQQMLRGLESGWPQNTLEFNT